MNNEYDDKIDAYGKKYNVDPKIIKLIFGMESSFGKDLRTSTTGNKGHMQLSDELIKRYGVKDPNNIDEALNAGTQYLRERLDAEGSVEGGIQGYFAGPDHSKWGQNTNEYLNRARARWEATKVEPSQKPNQPAVVQPVATTKTDTSTPQVVQTPPADRVEAGKLLMEQIRNGTYKPGSPLPTTSQPASTEQATPKVVEAPPADRVEAGKLLMEQIRNGTYKPGSPLPAATQPEQAQPEIAKPEQATVPPPDDQLPVPPIPPETVPPPQSKPADPVVETASQPQTPPPADTPPDEPLPVPPIPPETVSPPQNLLSGNGGNGVQDSESASKQPSSATETGEQRGPPTKGEAAGEGWWHGFTSMPDYIGGLANKKVAQMNKDYPMLGDLDKFTGLSPEVWAKRHDNLLAARNAEYDARFKGNSVADMASGVGRMTATYPFLVPLGSAGVGAGAIARSGVSSNIAKNAVTALTDAGTGAVQGGVAAAANEGDWKTGALLGGAGSLAGTALGVTGAVTGKIPDPIKQAFFDYTKKALPFAGYTGGIFGAASGHPEGVLGALAGHFSADAIEFIKKKYGAEIAKAVEGMVNGAARVPNSTLGADALGVASSAHDRNTGRTSLLFGNSVKRD